jgi:hypothetical protein
MAEKKAAEKEPVESGVLTETALPKEVKVEVVLHDARYIDVRLNREIRRVKDKHLAAAHNKLGEFIYLDAGVWEKADYAPYAKPKKK